VFANVARCRCQQKTVSPTATFGTVGKALDAHKQCIQTISEMNEGIVVSLIQAVIDSRPAKGE